MSSSCIRFKVIFVTVLRLCSANMVHEIEHGQTAGRDYPGIRCFPFVSCISASDLACTHSYLCRLELSAFKTIRFKAVRKLQKSMSSSPYKNVNLAPLYSKLDETPQVSYTMKDDFNNHEYFSHYIIDRGTLCLLTLFFLWLYIRLVTYVHVTWNNL
jgi:hypothetical protein